MDFSGGLVVHVAAAIIVLCFRLVMDRNPPSPTKNTVNANSVALCVTLVSFTWFGFHAGKAYTAGPIAVQAVANTIAAQICAVLSWFILETLIDKEFNVVAASNAILIGLISISSGAGYVTIGGAMCISILTTFMVFLLSELSGERAAKDTLSVVTLHGVGGLMGFALTPVFSSLVVNSGGQGRDGLIQGFYMPAVWHLVTILLLIPGIIFGTVLCLLFANFIVPLKKPDEDMEDPVFDKGVAPPTELELAQV